MRCLIALSPVLLLACHQGRPATGMPIADGRIATARLVTAGGLPAGTARVTEVAGGLRVTVAAAGLQPGTHGSHLHTVGRCDAPDFASAGGHWNPAGTQHGAMNPRGPHAGDLPNLLIGPDGRGTVAVLLAGASLDALLDADGAALVVHAGADDLMTDPSGNSGARLACGVLALR